jgi:formiminoglutamase
VVGLTAQEALDMCFVAGKNPNVKVLSDLLISTKVRLFDLSEYNPVIEEYRTGKLVGAMFYYFCMGVAVRKQTK